MGFFSSIANFLAKPIVGTIGSIATGLLGQKGANDRKATNCFDARTNAVARALV